MIRRSRRQDPNLPLSPSVLGRALIIQHSRLAGFRHHAAPRLWPALKSGTTLTLEAESENPEDPDAIAVYWRGSKLGYLPRTENLVAGRLLARDRSLLARVKRLVPDADANHRLLLDVLMVGPRRH